MKCCGIVITDRTGSSLGRHSHDHGFISGCQCRRGIGSARNQGGQSRAYGLDRPECQSGEWPPDLDLGRRHRGCLIVCGAFCTKVDPENRTLIKACRQTERGMSRWAKQSARVTRRISRRKWAWRRSVGSRRSTRLGRRTECILRTWAVEEGDPGAGRDAVREEARAEESGGSG